ncbi:hypothetical protein [Actinophytocola sp.]|uniref:hypothetical protein n=1 Tax=Actinophytocola sp. TaxID=1872138 RepID=UPI002D7FF88B|nr:hypothetical protein [Actinophytocola sp.]HET9138148.1 hypothetical protein [Actinophytocola sp.]
MAALAGRVGPTVTRLVLAVTNPLYAPGRDPHVQYREHLVTALTAEPWARVIKLSDFTDNGVGLVHTAGPKLAYSARKYDPVVPIMQMLLDLPDTPLSPDVRRHITAQLNLARQRFAAILAA